jgi:excisionase family DNA binding protein
LVLDIILEPKEARLASRELLTAREAAEYLQIVPRTFHKLARERRIPAIKVGGQWRFDVNHFARWAESQARMAGAESDTDASPEETTPDVVGEASSGDGKASGETPVGKSAGELRLSRLRRTWERAFRKTKSLALAAGAAVEVAPQPGHASLEGAVRFWLADCLSAHRSSATMELRLGLADGRPATLQQCGDALKLTRERARQIQEKAERHLRRPEMLFKLDGLWTAVARSAEAEGGIISLDALGAALTRRFGWLAPPRRETLAAVLKLCPACLVWGDRVILKGREGCLQCESLGRTVMRLVQKWAAMPLSRANRFLARTCQRCADTPLTQRRRAPALPAAELLQSDESLRAVARIHGDVLYSLDEWLLRYGCFGAAAVVLLRRCGRTMHYKKIAEELRRIRQDCVTTEGLHMRLLASADVLRWDRGTFIHRDHIQVPVALCEEIGAWIKAQLPDRASSLSVTSVYKHFEQSCRDAHVPSQAALYSCLRRSAVSGLAYPRFPRVVLS